MHETMHETKVTRWPDHPNHSSASRPKSWYCSIGGKQIALGKNRDEALKTFHGLMIDQSALSDGRITVHELCERYIVWCEAIENPQRTNGIRTF